MLSGDVSATTILTSTAIAQKRLEDCACPLDMRPTFGRIGRLRKIETVLRQRDYQIGIILQPGAPDGRASV